MDAVQKKLGALDRCAKKPGLNLLQNQLTPNAKQVVPRMKITEPSSLTKAIKGRKIEKTKPPKKGLKTKIRKNCEKEKSLVEDIRRFFTSTNQQKTSGGEMRTLAASKMPKKSPELGTLREKIDFFGSISQKPFQKHLDRPKIRPGCGEIDIIKLGENSVKNGQKQTAAPATFLGHACWTNEKAEVSGGARLNFSQVTARKKLSLSNKMEEDYRERLSRNEDEASLRKRRRSAEDDQNDQRDQKIKKVDKKVLAVGHTEKEVGVHDLEFESIMHSKPSVARSSQNNTERIQKFS